MGDSGRDTQYWLLALPLEGGRNRPKDGSDHVLATLKDKAGDLATTHKVRVAVAGACLSLPVTDAACLVLPLPTVHSA